jgi:hypothetical protein
MKIHKSTKNLWTFLDPSQRRRQEEDALLSWPQLSGSYGRDHSLWNKQTTIHSQGKKKNLLINSHHQLVSALQKRALILGLWVPQAWYPMGSLAANREVQTRVSRGQIWGQTPSDSIYVRLDGVLWRQWLLQYYQKIWNSNLSTMDFFHNFISAYYTEFYSCDFSVLAQSLLSAIHSNSHYDDYWRHFHLRKWKGTFWL